MNSGHVSPGSSGALQKMRTRIQGLDDILHGGLPGGRTSLISGGPGSGKSVIGLEVVYRGAMSGSPGIFVSFEESAENIRCNASTLGWDLQSLEKAEKLFILDARVDPQVATSGEFNLGGLLAVLDTKRREIGADRIVVDALDGLMRFFSDAHQQQNQLLVLHRWLMEQGLTSLLTAKKQNGPESATLCQNDFLDFLADCVLYLDQEIKGRVATKMLRVIKYRGSAYGGNAYPFLITKDGVYFHPITNMLMNYEASDRWLSSGNAEIDAMLGGGYQQGRCVLIAGEPGTGKTTLAATFAHSACREGQKVLYVSYEESRQGLVAGMAGMGIDLEPALKTSDLEILPFMPESTGVEEHLFLLMKTIERFQPHHLIVDAVSACHRIAGEAAAFDFIIRLVSACRDRGITVMLNNQVGGSFDRQDFSGVGISSIIDTIVTLHYRDLGDEMQRFLLILKARGKNHSNRYHQYSLTERGIVIER